MKKRIKQIAAAIIALAVVSTVLWRIGWIDEPKEVALLYGLLAVEITVTLVADVVKKVYRIYR